MAEAQPVRLLIAALGGEGGGVLAGWISEAAAASGLVVSRTSIPGVAQRTGATTYYIEVTQTSDGSTPILGLNPAPGQVDILLATELVEAARMVQAGFVTPGRTLVIAADRRVYATDEKIAMGDGRASEDQLRGAIERFSRRLVLSDLATAAAASKSQLNVVMLGVFAGLKALPIEAETFRATIRAEGKAVDANLRGFEAGLKLARSLSPRFADLSSDCFSAGEGRGEGRHERRRRRLPPPLTLTLSPLKGGEREQARRSQHFPSRRMRSWTRGSDGSSTTRTRLMPSAIWRACGGLPAGPVQMAPLSVSLPATSPCA